MSKQETQAGENTTETPQENQTEEGNLTQKTEQAAENPAEASAKEGFKAATPEEQIAELEKRLADTHDQLLRKAADFENFRKRMNQEKQSLIDYANQSLLLDIIPVIDDIERAIQAGENGLQANNASPAVPIADFSAFLEGVKIIEKRLAGQLETKWGLKRFCSAGETFDPNLHEALMMEKSHAVTEATVQEDLVKGYMLKDRVIRAAKVKVIMPEA